MADGASLPEVPSAVSERRLATAMLSRSRFRPFWTPTLLGFLVALASPAAASPDQAPTRLDTRGRRASARSRSVRRPSPRAFEHWLRAQLARTPAEARDQLLLALVYDEDALALNVALTETELQLGAPRSARRALAQVRRRAPRSAVRSRLESALAALRGDAERALSRAQRAFHQSPRWTPEGAWLLGRAQAVSPETARTVAQRLEARLPSRPEPARAARDAWAARGKVEDLTRALGFAELAYARSEDPKDADALVELDHRLGAHARALARARVWLEARADPSAWARVIRTAAWSGEPSVALAAAQEGARLGAEPAVVAALAEARLVARNRALRATFDPKRGARRLLRAAARRPTTKTSTIGGPNPEDPLWRSLLEGAVRVEHDPWLAEGRARAPDAPGWVAAEGRLAGLRGDVEHARKQLGRALRLDPDRRLFWTWWRERRNEARPEASP